MRKIVFQSERARSRGSENCPHGHQYNMSYFICTEAADYTSDAVERCHTIFDNIIFKLLYTAQPNVNLSKTIFFGAFTLCLFPVLHLGKVHSMKIAQPRFRASISSSSGK